eukprot:673010-Hanusia_phi.AAC.3
MSPGHDESGQSLGFRRRRSPTSNQSQPRDMTVQDRIGWQSPSGRRRKLQRAGQKCRSMTPLDDARLRLFQREISAGGALDSAGGGAVMRRDSRASWRGGGNDEMMFRSRSQWVARSSVPMNSIHPETERIEGIKARTGRNEPGDKSAQATRGRRWKSYHRGRRARDCSRLMAALSHVVELYPGSPLPSAIIESIAGPADCCFNPTVCFIPVIHVAECS